MVIFSRSITRSVGVPFAQHCDLLSDRARQKKATEQSSGVEQRHGDELSLNRCTAAQFDGVTEFHGQESDEEHVHHCLTHGDVAVNHTLWCAGATRGVEQQGNILRQWRGQFVVATTAAGCHIANPAHV
jgi:hypothetical protein